MRKMFFLFSLITGLTVNIPAQAQSPGLDFSKAWFKPFIAQSKDTACNSLLSQAQQDFFSTLGTRSLGEGSTGPIPNSQVWTWQATTPKEGLLVIKDAKVYARTFIGHGCGGACESEYAALSQSPFPETNSYASDISFSENQLTNKVPAYESNSGLYKHQNGSYYAITKSKTINVYKPTPNATWDKVCVIAITPDEKTYIKIQETYNSINKLSEIVRSALMGNEGSYCGSMHTLSRWKRSIHQNLETTLYRPWILHEAINDSTYAIDITNLESWSLKDISQKFAFDDYKKQLAIATKDLSLFYQKNYQWPAPISEKVATTALQTAISSGISFDRYDHPSKPQKALLNAIAEKQPASVIKSLAEVPDAMTESTLNMAITYPEALEFLLTKNSNPNQQNQFNKTLLMYAAQYNQLESAKTLLSKGANPNLFTIIPEDTCHFTLSKSNMTALHYAVRYASADLVKLLLKSGANPFASTSEPISGRPIDWLRKYTEEGAPEKNNNLTKENVAELEKLLSMPSADEAIRRALNFNLAAEQAFQKGKLDDAYNNSTLALSLDESNERALSNLSLILIKQGKQNEALEVSNKLITKGKDANQIANAWFNYGLICEKSTRHQISYNGNSYCQYGALYPFIESYKAKPTPGRTDKILNLIKENKVKACGFSPDKDGLIMVIQSCGTDNFCVLHSKDRSINLNTFALLKQSHENPNDLKSPVKIYAVQPMKIVESFALGNYQLTRLARHFGETTVKFGDQICTESSELLPISAYH